MNARKRLFAVLMSLTMVLAYMPAIAFADVTDETVPEEQVTEEQNTEEQATEPDAVSDEAQPEAVEAADAQDTQDAESVETEESAQLVTQEARYQEEEEENEDLGYYYFERDGADTLYYDGKVSMRIQDSYPEIPAGGTAELTVGVRDYNTGNMKKVFTDGKEYTFEQSKMKVTLDGSKVAEKLDSSEDIEVYLKVTYGNGNICWQADGYVYYQQHYDYSLPEDEEMLTGAENWFSGEVYVYEYSSENQDVEHQCKVTDMTVVSGADCLEKGLVKDNEDNTWGMKAVKEGTVKLRMTYTDIEGAKKTHDFNVVIKDILYDVEIIGATPDCILPGASLELTAEGAREYIDNKGEYHRENSGFEYGWRITTGADAATITTGSSKAKLTVNDNPELSGKEVKAEVFLKAGGKEVETDSRWIYISQDYHAIYPLEFGNLEIGETASFTPELRHYSYAGGEDYNSERYQTVASDFTVRFNPEEVEIVSGGKKIQSGDTSRGFTVKRLRGEVDGFELSCEDAGTWYNIGSAYHDIEFEDNTGFVAKDGKLKLNISTADLPKNWATYYDLVFRVETGEWEKNSNGRYEWNRDKSFEKGVHFTTSGTSIELIGSKLANQAEDVAVFAELKAKLNSEIVGSTDTWISVGSPYVDPLSVKSLWASQHSVGKVLFKWSKKDGVNVSGWNLKYRTRKIGGNAKWSGWTTKSYAANTYQAWINIPKDYVIEIHAQAKGDTTWSTGIITTPAGGKYHAMKTAHVIDTKTGKKLKETTAKGSSIAHTAIKLKVGQTLSVKPAYDYDPKIKDFKKRPKLYPNHMLYDIGDKSMITITKPDKSTYTGGIIEGAATIKATKAGTTTIVFRSPNGRTMIADVTITK